MLHRTFYQAESLFNHNLSLISRPKKTNYRSNGQIDELIEKLNGSGSWGERQRAARKLGYLKAPEAVSPLLSALPSDSFWMVRLAIIQALEKIGDPRAIPTLRRIERADAFHAVRYQATKAIATLSA